VHGFALHEIIGRFANVVGRPELASLAIASKQQTDRAYKEAIGAFFSADDSWNVKSTIIVNRQRLATEEDWAPHGERVREAVKLYESKLRDQGVYDFLDVIAIAVELVEGHRAVRQVLTAEYPHLYVDEYQDLAPGLDRLVRALCFDQLTNSELFAVGDPDQAIFSFTGTRPELLHALAGRSDVASVELEHNYRCGQAIIQVANRMRQGRPPIIGNRDGGQVGVRHCPGGLEDQYRNIVATVVDAQQRGVPLHEIGVLAPLNDQCKRVAELLRQAGIPAFFRDSDSTYRLTVVTGMIEGAAAWATLGRERSHYRLGDLLRRWRAVLGGRWKFADDVALTNLLLGYREEAHKPAADLIADFRRIGLSEALSQVALADEALEVRRMSGSLTTGGLQGISVQALAERAHKVDRVEVTTMTSSKGLEFDMVLLAAADNQSIPSWLSRTDEQLAEERRKFYVSITRARNELRIFYSGFVVTKWGTPKYGGPSPYLREIGLVQ
jgi:DNA helicase-2/ATP-dependent DNA helicase PcrA